MKSEKDLVKVENEDFDVEFEEVEPVVAPAINGDDLDSGDGFVCCIGRGAVRD